MQIYDNDFHHKGLSKSHSSYFSPNPDNRSKNEVSFQKRKNREREEEHLEKRGVKLESPSESDISFRVDGKKQCTCRGTNLSCYKCNGTGFIEINYENPLLSKPLEKTDDYASDEKKTKTIILTTKISKNPVFKCPNCEREYDKESSLKLHIEAAHPIKYSRNTVAVNKSYRTDKKIKQKLFNKKDGLKVVNKIKKKVTLNDLVNKGWTIK